MPLSDVSLFPFLSLSLCSFPPALGGDVFNKMEISNQSSELEVNYDCHPKGKGTSFIWVSIKVSQYESMENCHYSLPEGRGQTFTFLWSKYCPGNLKPRKGFNIGTYKGGNDVVRDGVPVVQFTPSYIKHDYHQVRVRPRGGGAAVAGDWWMVAPRGREMNDARCIDCA